MKTFLKVITLFIIILVLISSSSSIYAFKIVLDAGHGGSDSGAISASGIYEKTINLKVTKYLQEYLSQYDDVEVILTHNGNFSGKLEVVDRSMFARNQNPDLLLCLHFNSSNNTNVNGAEVYVTRCDNLKKFNEDTTTLGNLMLNNLNKLGIKKNGVKTRLCEGDEAKYQYSDGGPADYYGIIRYAMKGDALDFGIPITSGEGLPTVLIEHCYMSGNADIQYFDSDADLRNIAKADAAAIVEFYGLTISDPTKVKLVSLEKEKNDIAIGDTVKLNATVLPETATNKTLTYASQNPEIAIVDSNGNIKGLAEGSTIITVTSQDGGKVAEFIANITPVNISVESNQINILEGNTAQISTIITPTSLTNKNVAYVSSNPEIVTVNESGVVTGVTEGTATVTATTEFGNKYTQITVNVSSAQAYSININNRNVENSIISKINENTIVGSILNDIAISNNLNITVINHKGETLNNDNLATTGSKVIVKDRETQNTVAEYYLVITGDVNRDGKISPADYVLIKNHIMEKMQLTGVQINAADVKKDSNISAGDYVLIKNHIMGTRQITAN